MEPTPSFETRYREGSAPWDIGRPQPVVITLGSQGAFHGDILDVGCGTGENSLYLASLGHSVFGLDFSPTAIEQAQKKSRERKLEATFWEGNALQLASLNRAFDTLLDSALFHVFKDEERPLYAEGIRQVLKPGGLFYLLCFSDQEPPGWGPRRVSQEEIRKTFEKDFLIRSIEESSYDTLMKPHVRSWLSLLSRR